MASMHDAIVYMYDLSTTNTYAYGKNGVEFSPRGDRDALTQNVQESA